MKWLNFRTAVLPANADADIYCTRDAFAARMRTGFGAPSCEAPSRRW